MRCDASYDDNLLYTKPSLSKNLTKAPVSLWTWHHICYMSFDCSLASQMVAAHFKSSSLTRCGASSCKATELHPAVVV